ncbi:Scr1 family TA system antitoxin-like transcriptional regulator [Phytohabitans kaempferiae]|uniref:Scr1 family TA system antitoxin-like transcriptional regulator n=1 Tax=Phytohabitans kaempferiae TaxID=1620943 RepID=A0ABV6LV52_9ACTN
MIGVTSAPPIGHHRDPVSDAQVDWWVRTYRDRQQAMHDRVTSVRAVLGQSVLRRPVDGPTGTLPAQREHLTKLHGDGSGGVQVRVLPAQAGYVPWMDGWFTIFELPEPYPRPVACTDHHRVAIHEGPAAEQYAGVFDQLWTAALGPSESVALIGRLTNDLSIYSTNQ